MKVSPARVEAGLSIPRRAYLSLCTEAGLSVPRRAYLSLLCPEADLSVPRRAYPSLSCEHMAPVNVFSECSEKGAQY